MALHIAPITPGDESALRAWFGIESAVRTFDRPDEAPPTWAEIRATLDAPWPGRATSAWLATLDGEPAGIALEELPTRDNLDTAPVRVTVAPPWRRRGVGRELLALLTARARENGRIRMFGEVFAPLDDSNPGIAFADAAGAVCAQVEIGRRLEFADIDHATWARLAADAERPGYTLVRWIGDTPAEWQEDVALMETRMSTDAPHGDLHTTAEVHDVGSVRERDDMCRARGITVLTTAAVAPDGSMAGYSEASLAEHDTPHAQTWNTLVAAAHRGHRLGMRLKLATLQFLIAEFPAVQRISTWNAHDNTHMIAINDAVGFRPRTRLLEYELELGAQAGSNGSISAAASGP